MSDNFNEVIEKFDSIMKDFDAECLKKRTDFYAWFSKTYNGYDLQSLAETNYDFKSLDAETIKGIMQEYTKAINDVYVLNVNDSYIMSCKEEILFILQDKLGDASIVLLDKSL